MKIYFFITTYVNSSKEKAFQLLYHTPKRVNKVVRQKSFVEDWVHYIVFKEEVQPIMNSAKQLLTSPDWDKLKISIENKYNSYYADRIIIDAKSRWYASKNKWNDFTKYSVEFVNKYGSNMSDLELAKKAWSVFLYSFEKAELNSALEWSKRILEKNKDSLNVLPAVMDTYANLIYKINYLFDNNKNNTEAIGIEEKALAVATKHNLVNRIEAFKKVINKMTNGEITWRLK